MMHDAIDQAGLPVVLGPERFLAHCLYPCEPEAAEGRGGVQGAKEGRRFKC